MDVADINARAGGTAELEKATAGPGSINVKGFNESPSVWSADTRLDIEPTAILDIDYGIAAGAAVVK
jgi:hypothetical protein